VAGFRHDHWGSFPRTIFWSVVLPICVPIIPISSTRFSALAAAETPNSESIKNLARNGRWILPVNMYHISGDLLHVKLYNMRPVALLSFRRKSCHRFLLPLKTHCSRLGLNPRTLGPMITITLPRTTGLPYIGITMLLDWGRVCQKSPGQHGLRVTVHNFI
jgi:hypothetical protein